MNELTRGEKARNLYKEEVRTAPTLMQMTDQEINELYDQHFNQVTLEDFEGFKKVCGKLNCPIIEVNDAWLDLDEIKKELNL